MTSGTVYARRGIRQDKWNSNTHERGIRQDKWYSIRKKWVLGRTNGTVIHIGKGY